MIRSFEIPPSIGKLHKDFKSVFVFKFRQKTKKFTPKWQNTLLEKRVLVWARSCSFMRVCARSCSFERGQLILDTELGLRAKDTMSCPKKAMKISHLNPNQSAPSIYFMIELCYFSLDQ